MTRELLFRDRADEPALGPGQVHQQSFLSTEMLAWTGKAVDNRKFEKKLVWIESTYS